MNANLHAFYSDHGNYHSVEYVGRLLLLEEEEIFVHFNFKLTQPQK